MARKYFAEGFGSDVYGGESISAKVGGFTITATIHRDEDSSPPWKRGDGFGPVSEWTRRDKRPGELVLNQDRGSYRYYDFAEAVKIAKRDGWGVANPPEGATKAQIAELAARADYDRLRGWCNDEWTFVGVAVTVEKAGVRLTGAYDHALWGLESDAGGYCAEVASDLADEAVSAARAKLAELCGEEC